MTNNIEPKKGMTVQSTRQFSLEDMRKAMIILAQRINKELGQEKPSGFQVNKFVDDYIQSLTPQPQAHLNKEGIIECLREATEKSVTKDGVKWELLYSETADKILSLSTKEQTHKVDAIKLIEDADEILTQLRVGSNTKENMFSESHKASLLLRKSIQALQSKEQTRGGEKCPECAIADGEHKHGCSEYYNGR